LKFEKSVHTFCGRVLFIGKTTPFSLAHFELIDSGLRYITQVLGLTVDCLEHIIGSAQLTSFKTHDPNQMYDISIFQRNKMISTNTVALSRIYDIDCSIRMVDDVDSDELWVRQIVNSVPAGTIMITSNLSGVKQYFDLYAPGYFGFVHCSEHEFGKQDQQILKALNIESVHATEIRTFIAQGKLELAKKFLTKETIEVLGL
jgi:hypothetical protein